MRRAIESFKKELSTLNHLLPESVIFASAEFFSFSVVTLAELHLGKSGIDVQRAMTFYGEAMKAIRKNVGTDPLSRQTLDLFAKGP